ncbi:hypothetical protein HanRHA438_Chr16g0740851 [Helianthus annuus]|nr:hypothetical protein HanRHA438_Chr16g0740851 [Helianthus annuus]
MFQMLKMMFQVLKFKKVNKYAFFPAFLQIYTLKKMFQMLKMMFQVLKMIQNTFACYIFSLEIYVDFLLC